MERWEVKTPKAIAKAQEIRKWLEENDNSITGASKHFNLARINIWRYVRYLKTQGYIQPPTPRNKNGQFTRTK